MITNNFQRTIKVSMWFRDVDVSGLVHIDILHSKRPSNFLTRIKMRMVFVQSSFITISVSTSENGTDAKLQYRLVNFGHNNGMVVVISQFWSCLSAYPRWWLAGAVGFTKCRGFFIARVISVRTGPFMRTFSTRAIGTGTMATHCTVPFTPTPTTTSPTSCTPFPLFRWWRHVSVETLLFVIVEGWTWIWNCFTKQFMRLVQLTADAIVLSMKLWICYQSHVKCLS